MAETTETKQVCRAALTLLFPELDFKVKQCGKYTREDFPNPGRDTFDHVDEFSQSEPIIKINSNSRCILLRPLETISGLSDIF